MNYLQDINLSKSAKMFRFMIIINASQEALKAYLSKLELGASRCCPI